MRSLSNDTSLQDRSTKSLLPHTLLHRSTVLAIYYITSAEKYCKYNVFGWAVAKLTQATQAGTQPVLCGYRCQSSPGSRDQSVPGGPAMMFSQGGVLLPWALCSENTGPTGSYGTVWFVWIRAGWRAGLWWLGTEWSPAPPSVASIPSGNMER